MAVGWARGRRDSAHGTWISRRARSWRRACCCRRAAAGNPTHVRGMACGGDMERSRLRLFPPALRDCSTAARVSVASAHPTLDCDRLLQVLQVLQVFQVLQVLQVPVQRLAAPDTNSDSLFYIQQTD